MLPVAERSRRDVSRLVSGLVTTHVRRKLECGVVQILFVCIQFAIPHTYLIKRESNNQIGGVPLSGCRTTLTLSYCHLVARRTFRMLDSVMLLRGHLKSHSAVNDRNREILAWPSCDISRGGPARSLNRTSLYFLSTHHVYILMQIWQIRRPRPF
jgi:hypothetical protein